MATSTLTVIQAAGVDPLAASNLRNTGSLRSRLRRFARVLVSVIGGQVKRASVIVGTAAASGTATLVTAVATNLLTINGANCTAIQLHARATVTFDGLLADDTVTVQGIVFTAKASPTAGSLLQFALGANDTAAAQNLAAKIRAHPSLSGIIGALGAAGATTTGVVSLRAVAYGTGPNAYTLATSNNTRAAKSGTTLASGAAPSGDQWDYGDNDTQGAASLAACINRSTTALIANHVTASSALGVCTVTAKKKDTSGNAITFARTGSPITVNVSRLAGGTETTASL